MIIGAPAFILDAVARQVSRALQNNLLQLALGISIERLLAQLGDHRQDDAGHKVTGDLWSLVNLDGPNQGFQHVSTKRITRTIIEGTKISDIDTNIGEKTELLPNPGQDAAADNLGFEGGHLAFRGIGEATVDMLDNVSANNGVSQELQRII